MGRHPQWREGAEPGRFARRPTLGDHRRTRRGGLSRSTRDSAAVGLARFDAAGRCLLANDHLCKISGLARDEILGQGWRRALVPPVEARLEGLWSDLRDGRSVAASETWERPDGRRISIDIEASPERNAEGRVTAILCSIVDVTARLRAAEADARTKEQLAARADELEELYRVAPVGLCVLNRRIEYVRANDAYADIVGRSVEDLIGRSLLEVVPESARDAAAALVRRVIESEEPALGVELRRQPEDPTRDPIWMANVHPLVRDGEVLGAVASLQNVTTLRRAQETAAQRLEELEILYEHTPVGLCHTDAELRVVHVNPLFARLSDRPLAEQIGVALPELLPGELDRQLTPQLRHVLRSGVSSLGARVEGRTATGDPTFYSWQAHTHPVKDADGRVSGLVTVLQDVTSLAERQRRVETVRDRLVEAQRVARVGSWEWNFVEDVVWWSDEMFSIFGEGRSYEPSYVGFFEHVHPDDRGVVRHQLERILEDGSPHRVTFRIQRGDGSLRTLFAAARLERSEGGVAARVVGTCQDVTELDGFETE